MENKIKRRKINYFDSIKIQKYSPLSPGEEINQFTYFKKWINEMLFRKQKGNEKYGNYMMDVDDETSFRELEEEMIDVCNHLVMLTYKLKKRIIKNGKNI